MEDPVVRVAGLRVSFETSGRVLDGIDLLVRPGEIVALVGANGAGKSTLLRALIGLVQIGEGDVVVDGTAVAGASQRELRALRARVGFAFQRFCLAGRLTALHNTLHGALGRCGPRGWWPATAAEHERLAALACLERVGVGDLADRRVHTLSGGQQQRVTLARMLMQRPCLVLADEPVASLDPSAGLLVMTLLREIAEREGLPVIVALHQLDYARRFADRVVGLADGRVTLDSPMGACDAVRLDRLYAKTA